MKEVDARNLELDELRTLLLKPGGRYFIWRVLSKCGVFHSLSTNDAMHMAIRSGKRDIGLWVLDEVFTADPQSFYTMQKEANERESSREPDSSDRDEYGNAPD